MDVLEARMQNLNEALCEYKSFDFNLIIVAFTSFGSIRIDSAVLSNAFTKVDPPIVERCVTTKCIDITVSKNINANKVWIPSRGAAKAWYSTSAINGNIFNGRLKRLFNRK
jgi:hypothetical protein